MRTARLPTIRVSVAMEGWVSPVYKFEQVTSDDHQMSVAGGGATTLPRHGTGIPSPPPPLHPATDIWCSSLETCSNCLTGIPTLP